MLIEAPYVYRVVRPDADLSDLTASVEIAPRVIENETLLISFDVEPTQAEQDRIIIRLITENLVEETLVIRAKTALALNANWRAIASPTAVQAFDYLDTVSRELDALIRVLLRWLDTSE